MAQVQLDLSSPAFALANYVRNEKAGAEYCSFIRSP